MSGEIPNLSIWRWAVPSSALTLMLLLWVMDANTHVFVWLNLASTTLGDTFWSYVTVLGDTVSLLLILLFCGRRPQVVWQFFIAALFAILWTQGLKEPLGVLRPPVVLGSEQFHLIGAVLQHNSFPSGHTTTIFLLAGILCLQRLQAPIKIALLSLALLVGISRIACGVHWPLDVLGGALGGWGAAVAGNWLGMRWQVGLGRILQRIFALLLLTVACWVIFHRPDEFTRTHSFQVTLALLATAISLPALMRLFNWRS
ncbi:MAG: phosphatase PAP2 family protein [Pseudomonadota bacterium]